jgi:hypothetical protein
LDKIVVCVSSSIRIASGCFIWVNMVLVIVLVDMSNFVISGGILYKILVLGINEMVYTFPQKFLEGFPYF